MKKTTEGTGEKVLDEFNQSTLDDSIAPVGIGKMTILKNMESLDQERDQYMQGLKGGEQRD